MGQNFRLYFPECIILLLIMKCRDETIKSLPQIQTNANSIMWEAAAYNRASTGVSDHVVRVCFLLLLVCMCVFVCVCVCVYERLWV